MPKLTVCEETATATTTGPVSERGVVPIAIITPGWGSSGYYSGKVLENAAAATVFAKGTHMYLDHPAESEKSDRPERSVRDLVAVLESDATWDGKTLAGEAKVFGPYRDLFRDEDFVAAIGVSIRAAAEYTVGEADGRKGAIITRLEEAKSIDFVTRPGRGGAVLSVMESARREAHEAMSEDIRTLLDRAVEVATTSNRAWVRDFDPDQGAVVYTQVDQDDEDGFLTSMWRDTYTIGMDGLSAELGGSPVEVRPRTEYVPVPPNADTTESAPETSPAPAAGLSTATESEETTMATTQIEEAELGRLREDAERVPTLTSERDTAVQESTRLRDELRTERATNIINEAATDFTPLERAGLLANLPTVEESGDLDADAFRTTVTEAAAERATATGAGTVRSFGNTTSTTGGIVTESDADAAVASAFGRTIPKGA